MIGALFTEAREALGLSKRGLEREYRKRGFSVTHQVISKWEDGRGNPCRQIYLAPLLVIYAELASKHNETAERRIPSTIDAARIGLAIMATIEEEAI